jgi:amino acid permease
MPDNTSFFGGQNILDGMPLRRAGTILFAIEARTAQLVAQSRQALAPYRTEKTAAEKEQAFLAAIAQGRDLPIQPTIQDLERFAPEWTSLVPADENQRAALAKKILEKYRFRYQDVPALRNALGLETDSVKQAYQTLFQKSIDSIYITDIPPAEQLRWLGSRISNRFERLPPFWTAYALSVTETIGGGILALPIALAGVGPIPGVMLLILLGLVNVATVMGIAESITRNGNMRYGTTYLGRLVDDYLGKTGSIILVLILLILNTTYLMAASIGVSVSLADLTSISPLLWAALLCLIAVYFLQRESLNATVASALMIGMVSILIIFVLCLLAVPHIRAENLQYVGPVFAGGRVFNLQLLELIFGVILYAYYGHTAAANAAKVVLRRDPGGKALIWGNILAMLTIIVVYSVWVLAVNGSIPSTSLIHEAGTALSPLAKELGGVVPILGIVYVILAIGMSTVHTSYGLYYQIREALPSSVNKKTQALISLTPILLLFMIVEWIILTGRESFAQLLAIPGTILLPLLIGIFPMLMLVAARRKGEYAPKFSFAFLSNPFVLTLIYLIYIGSVFFYGVFIWKSPIERLFAFGVGIFTLIFTYVVMRQGAFAPRAVIELRIDASDVQERAILSLLDQGKPHVADFRLIYKNREDVVQGSEVEIPSYKQLREICIRFTSLSSQELKIWLHCVTVDRNSEPLSASIRMKAGNDDEVVQLDVHTGQVIKPLKLGPTEFEIELSLL